MVHTTRRASGGPGAPEMFAKLASLEGVSHGACLLSCSASSSAHTRYRSTGGEKQHAACPATRRSWIALRHRAARQRGGERVVCYLSQTCLLCTSLYTFICVSAVLFGAPRGRDLAHTFGSLEPRTERFLLSAGLDDLHRMCTALSFACRCYLGRARHANAV